MKVFLDFKHSVGDHYKHKFLSYKEVFCNFWRNRELTFKMYDFNQIKQFKTSDTIFILGSGPSLNNLTDEQINQINSKNSCGVNFSFLKKKIIPTFHQFSWESSFARDYLVSAFSSHREAYKDTVIFLNKKALFRFAHPKLTPDFFPLEPKCYLYELPEPMYMQEGEKFSDSEFDKHIYYRGTLSLVLHLLVELDYKNIVLIGVDLDTKNHFFNGFENMQEFLDKVFQRDKKLNRTKFESMYVKKGKAKPFDEYLYALADYLKRKRGINLFTANKDDFLSPRLVVYFN